MSQRLGHNQLSVGGALDAYPTKLLQKPLPESSKLKRKPLRQTAADDRASNRGAGPGGGALNSPLRQVNALKTDALVHKQMYTNSEALVEVTVKTHNKPKEKLGSPRVPRSKDSWSKLLKSQAGGENLSSFTHFDPLRTVHFLAQELQAKLIRAMPNDENVLSMILEMQQALNRVPREVMIKETLLDKPVQKQKPLKLVDFSQNVCPVQDNTESTTQTPRSMFVETHTFQRHLEESSEKIEKACNQMETLCTKLKHEKEEVEEMLRAERETSKLLSKELHEAKLENAATASLVDALRTKVVDQETTIKKMEAQLESQQGPSAMELKVLIQELRKEKLKAEEESVLARQRLTLANMEIEKYETILKARDTQVQEIRNEMSQLQEVVNEQLMELQNNPYSSEASMFTNMANPTSQSSTCATRKFEGDGNKVNQLFTNNIASGDTSSSSLPRNKELPLHEGLHYRLVRKRNERPTKVAESQCGSAVNTSAIRDQIAAIKDQALTLQPR